MLVCGALVIYLAVVWVLVTASSVGWGLGVCLVVCAGK